MTDPKDLKRGCKLASLKYPEGIRLICRSATEECASFVTEGSECEFILQKRHLEGWKVIEWPKEVQA